MPDADPARRRPLLLPRLAALAGAGLLLAGIAAPGALAQEAPPPPAPDGDPSTDPWAGSTFDPPFDEPDRTIRRQPFDVAGTLRYDKTGPADHIVEAEVRIVPAESLDEACELPAPVVVPGPGPQPDLVAELRFEVTGLRLTCNGRYDIEVEATLDDPDAPTRTVRQPFVLGALPPAVTDLAVALDEGTRQVTVTFAPVPAADLPPDAAGYVLERGGPARGVSAGEFGDVGVLDLDDEPRFVDDLADSPAGTYTYRVRTVRSGADGTERSSVIDTESLTVTVGEPSASPTTAAGDRGPRRGSVSVGRRGPSLPRRSVTITTLDTGFEGTIDYGADGAPAPTTDLEDLGGDEPVAGQSVIQDEGEGVDLAAPVAGALVLLGWAGHIAYLNRLARQLSPGP